MRTRLLIALGVLALATSLQGAEKTQKFEPTWESLKTYKCPDWFRDAKFGIFLSWGPHSVPAAGPWYARDMYTEGTPQYKYHLEHYGHPSKVGWKDIIPMWKAEKWDPDYVVSVLKKSGAKYIVPLAVYHDNYDLWDSRYHKWNSVNYGPKKDIIGAWRKAVLKSGLRFGVTEHLERSYCWFNVNKGADKSGPMAGVPYDGADPRYQDLYFPPHDDTAGWYPTNPPEWFKKDWYNRIKDLVDNYKPDLLYTDGGVPFGEVGRQLMADFYNENMSWHGGKLEAVYNIKNVGGHGEFVDGTVVEDLERGSLDHLKTDAWQTDTAIADWFYNVNALDDKRYGDPNIKSSRQLITSFVDIVSKNGNLLLNLALKPDGTIPEDQLSHLNDIGAWMKVNSEAIYATRPWKIYGEGPHSAMGGHLKESEVAYTSEDIRFTTRGNVLNVIALGWPEGDHFLIRSLDEKTITDLKGIRNIKLLGSKEKIEWKRSSDGLWIGKPKVKPCDHAFVFQVVFNNGVS